MYAAYNMIYGSDDKICNGRIPTKIIYDDAALHSSQNN